MFADNFHRPINIHKLSITNIDYTLNKGKFITYRNYMNHVPEKNNTLSLVEPCGYLANKL